MPQTGAKPSVAAKATHAVTPKKIAARADSMPAISLKSVKKPIKNQIPASQQGMGMDSAAVRARMVKLLAEGGITDQAVLSAMNTIERHRFVDTALAPQAYEDTSLPIGLSQTISKPNVVARMIALLREGAALDSQGRMGRVLEIGSGCGYQAAILSLLCKEVYSIERLRGLYDKALVNIRHLKAANLHLLLGDGMLGAPGGAPYSGIIAAAGGEAIPQAWVDQLAVGGRIVAPTGNGAAQSLIVIDKTARGLKQTVLESVLFVPLKSGVA
ncbi:MAG: protein-L-isoaspartate(D-aspartate) O-methyltransferase [Burkholderiales bacterium]|nr:MAG: protein-L-isoaspartate(D-aspartate) O-methyltransferase [Burkholderiales bacterium]